MGILVVLYVLCVYGSCYNKEERLRQHNTVSVLGHEHGSARLPERRRRPRRPCYSLSQGPGGGGVRGSLFGSAHKSIDLGELVAAVQVLPPNASITTDFRMCGGDGSRL